MGENSARERWEESGYLVVPRLFDAARVESLRALCDDVLRQWVAESPAPLDASNSTNMAYLTEPRYFGKHPEQLTMLLETIADQKILDLLAQLGEGEALFHNTQYFFEPADGSRDGDWHRDQQFGAPDEQAEKDRMTSTVGIHVHIALVPDDNLEYVPGSHARWDTPRELAIRKGLDGRQKNAPDMPHSVRIELAAGDACFFSAWGIHRGRYRAEHLRRTFDAIYGTPPRWMTTPPTCFLQPGVLDRLNPSARRFFERYIETYQSRWERGAHLQS